jgi:anti-sigma factor RsiW
MNVIQSERIPCLSDLFFDRLLAGEVDEVERSAGEAHLGGCPSCRGRLDAISAESVAFALNPPPLPTAPVRPAVAMRPRRWSRAGRWLAPGALLAAGVAASIALFQPSVGEGPGRGADQGRLASRLLGAAGGGGARGRGRPAVAAG